MLKSSLARRYAQALFEIGSENKTLDQTLKELDFLQNLFEEKGVAQVLNHPEILSEKKKALLNQLVSGQISDPVLHFIYLLIDRRRLVLYFNIKQEFINLYDQAGRIIRAKVSAAVALNPDQLNKLKDALNKITGKRIILVTEVRPELIGGVLVRMGDRVMDGTIKHALESMRENLFMFS